MTGKKYATFLAALLLAACTVGPNYQRPTVSTPAAFKEQGDWKPAQPAETENRGAWWEIFGDADLNALEPQVAVSNQNLKASEAAYRQAKAAAQEARAGFFPTVTVDASAQRGKNGRKSAVNAFGAGGSVDWELDVWGRIRRAVESQQAQAEASQADLASATLSAQATLAVDYFQLRATDALHALLLETAADDMRALTIAKNQYNAGIVSRADLIQAQSEVESVQAQAVNTGAARAELEHAIAVLIGRAPAEFTLPAQSQTFDIAAATVPTFNLPPAPAIPPTLPSTLLERQPDIAAAERRVAAANAEIGVAQAAYYPDISLSASDNLSNALLGSLISSASNVWAIGPQLAYTVFDGGARRAQVKEARAAYDQEVALYRQTVLTAFQGVEDRLADLNVLAQQSTIQDKAVADAQESARLILNQYKAGTVVYTNVITVQTQALNALQAALTLRQNRLTETVQLIEALGGSWASAPAISPNPKN